MLRTMLEKRGICLADTEFAMTMEMATDDIKFNRIRFKKCTSLNETIDIAIRSAMVLKRCA